jgi:DNA-binding NtrC family response regulator
VKKTILVVDDIALVTDSLSLLLEDDYNAVIFTTPACGKYVLEWLDGGVHLDFAILDILINGVSGVDIAQKILKLKPTCPILFITGCSELNAKYKEALALVEKYDHVYMYRKPYDDAVNLPLPTYLEAKLSELL